MQVLMLFIFLTALFANIGDISKTEMRERKGMELSFANTDSLIADFHVGAFSNSGGEIDTIRPGVVVDCISTGLFSFEKRENLDSIRIKVTEVNCTGNESPTLIYDSGNIHVEQGPQYSDQIFYEFLGIEMGPAGEESTCYFIRESALGNTVGKCYKIEYWQKNDWDSTYAFSYFQVDDDCPVITQGITVSDTLICAGDCIDFTTTAFWPISFHWAFPGGTPSNSDMQNPPNICYPAPGLYPVTLIYENCFNRDTIIKTDHIQVLPAPQATGPAENESILLAGDSIVLQACSLGDSYEWSPPTGLSCTDCPAPVASPSSGTEYTLLVGAAGGCTDTCRSNVLVGEPPTAAFGSGQPGICENDCLDFFFEGTGNVENYTWTFAGGEPAISNVQSPQGICYLAAGSYGVSLVVENIFGTDSLFFESYVSVAPEVGVTGGTVQPLSLAFGDSSLLSACATGEAYSWSPPDGLSCTDCPSPTLVASISADYSVEVSNGGNCSAVCEYPVTVSFDERIYVPNAFSPNEDGINDTFTAHGNYHRTESLKVFDRWGGMVWDVQGDVPWDGTFKGQPAQVGVYVYILEYTDTRTGELKMVSGDVVLLR